MSQDVINWLLVIEQVKIDYKDALWKKKHWGRNPAFQLFLNTLSDVIMEFGTQAENARQQRGE